MYIQLLALDVDGVLTDGHLTYTSEGEELKAFNTLDGLGLTALRQTGVQLAIITGRRSAIVERRAKELHIDHLHMGCGNKTQALMEICQEQGLDLKRVAYMGDDLNDLGPLSHVGLALAPANACDEAKALASYITTKVGGQGAVRQAVEYILQAEGKWEAIVDSYRNEVYEIGQ